MSSKNNKKNHWVISKKTTILNYKFWTNLFFLSLSVGICLLIVSLFTNVHYNKAPIKPDSFDGFLLSSTANNIFQLGFFSEASNRIMNYVSERKEISNLLSLHIVAIFAFIFLAFSFIFFSLSIFIYIKTPKNERPKILKDIDFESMISLRDYSQDIL